MQNIAVVGASDFNAQAFAQMNDCDPFDYFIAVDGGYAHLEALNITPDIAVGDFDSLGYVPRGVHTVQYPVEKDMSDMEIALERALQLHPCRVVVFGALGKRIDHTLANISLFARFCEEGMSLYVVGDGELLTILQGPGTFESPARKSGTVSVFALNDVCTGVFEKGLKWELDDCTLTNRTSLGLSNEFIGKAVQIGVTQGTLLIVLPL